MRKPQRVFVFLTILAIAATLLAGCAQSGAPSPTPGQTTPEPASTPAETSGEPDILTDVLKVRSVANGYSLQPVLVSAFGLPKQLAMLPNGDVVISDVSFWRIQLLSGGALRTLVSGDDLKMTAVAAMPDGRICYRSNDNLILLSPDTGAKANMGITPSGDYAMAITADSDGNVYAATVKGNLYRFAPDGTRTVITAKLPFGDVDFRISDLDVTADGTVYVSGFNRCVAVSQSGDITVIADDLHAEPTWCEVAPDGNVYVKDGNKGIRIYNPSQGKLTPIEINTDDGVSDLLALSTKELLFMGTGTEIIHRYNLTTETSTPVLVNSVNSRAFAVTDNGTAFFATANMPPTLQSHIIRLQADGTKEDITELSFDNIESADVDKENRLCLLADGKFYRINADSSVTSIAPRFKAGERPDGGTNLAVGPDGLWYCITSDFNEIIRVWRADETGEATLLPITFNCASFGDAYKVRDARISVGNNGQIALVVIAIGSRGRGPLYQHVYLADTDGSNLTRIASFTEDRIGGIVDIAFGSENEIYTMINKGPTAKGGTSIYKITSDGKMTEIINVAPGRDPKSLDVDAAGNVWFSTTVGVFRLVQGG